MSAVALVVSLLALGVSIVMLLKGVQRERRIDEEDELLQSARAAANSARELERQMKLTTESLGSSVAPVAASNTDESAAIAPDTDLRRTSGSAHSSVIADLLLQHVRDMSKLGRAGIKISDAVDVNEPEGRFNFYGYEMDLAGTSDVHGKFDRQVQSVRGVDKLDLPVWKLSHLKDPSHLKVKASNGVTISVWPLLDLDRNSFSLFEEQFDVPGSYRIRAD